MAFDTTIPSKIYMYHIYLQHNTTSHRKLQITLKFKHRNYIQNLISSSRKRAGKADPTKLTGSIGIKSNLDINEGSGIETTMHLFLSTRENKK